MLEPRLKSASTPHHHHHHHPPAAACAEQTLHCTGFLMIITKTHVNT